MLLYFLTAIAGGLIIGVGMRLLGFSFLPTVVAIGIAEVFWGMYSAFQSDPDPIEDDWDTVYMYDDEDDDEPKFA